MLTVPGIDARKESARQGLSYANGAGNVELPIRYSSTPLAHERPSAIAQTMSD